MRIPVIVLSRARWSLDYLSLMRIYNILEPRSYGILPREPQVTRVMSSPEVLQDHGGQLEDCGRVFINIMRNRLHLYSTLLYQRIETH